MPERKYLTLTNFSFGLDTRKSQLTSQPGTLLTLENGHVNQGGEIEKRKGFFVIDSNIPYFPTGTGYCFGMEVTSSGLYTFGSASSGTVGALPTGVTYQRLQHPDLSTAMTGVVYSTSFNGKAWVIARFADGNTYAYYDGSLVTDLTDGLVLASLNTNNLLATNLAAIINRSTTTQGYSSTHTGTNAFSEILSPVGSAFGNLITKTSAVGSLAGVLTTSNTPAVSNVAAIAQFRVVAGADDTGAGNCQITSIKVDATLSTEILTTAVNWTTSNEATAVLIAAQINANLTAYTAIANGSLVVIYASIASGAASNSFKLQTTATAATTHAKGFMIGDCSFSFSGTPSVTNILANGIAITNGGGPYTAANNGLLCETLAKNINAYTGTSGYIAWVPYDNAGNPLNTLRISKKVTSSADTQVSINPTLTAGGFVSGNDAPLVVSTSTLAASGKSTALNGTGGASVPVVAYASGGANNGYTYKWSVQNFIVSGVFSAPFVLTPAISNIIRPGDTTATVVFSLNLTNIDAAANFGSFETFCTVTDVSGNVTVSPIVSVSFTK